MKTMGLFEAKTKFSEICAHVADAGEPVVVTRRGKPLVRIEPVKDSAMTIRERRAAYMARYGRQEKKDKDDFLPPSRSKEMPRGIELE
ncbi:MAG: hypothetical protein BWY59_02254 [Verrucomicrobia bacterium ADurb.Bin345]|nr:MAG: hypothetical protein BWY59_02254 [Verrucomicrobia bacterium ADurb.Bin345]